MSYSNRFWEWVLRWYRTKASLAGSRFVVNLLCMWTRCDLFRATWNNFAWFPYSNLQIGIFVGIVTYKFCVIFSINVYLSYTLVAVMSMLSKYVKGLRVKVSANWISSYYKNCICYVFSALFHLCDIVKCSLLYTKKKYKTYIIKIWVLFMYLQLLGM